MLWPVKNADTYYGHKAASYDAKRRDSRKWKEEYRLIERMVTEGPVLDVPVGTGRFIPIYRAKGLAFEGADISSDMMAEAVTRYGEFPRRRCSIFSLPYEDQSFATVVCVRMAWLLGPDECAQAMREIARVGRTCIVSTRPEGLMAIPRPIKETAPITGRCLMVRF